MKANLNACQIKETRDIYMKEDSSINLLQNFAKQTGREIHSIVDDHKGGYQVYGPDNSKYVWIKDDQNPELYFVCYDSHLRTGPEVTYSGVFFSLRNSQTGSIYMMEKDFFDRIKAKLSSKILKTGNKRLDRKLLIKGDSFDMLRRLLSDHRTNDEIISFFNKYPALRISGNNKNIAFVDGLKDKALLGVYVLNSWITKPEEIEAFYELGEKILSLLNK